MTLYCVTFCASNPCTPSEFCLTGAHNLLFLVIADPPPQVLARPRLRPLQARWPPGSPEYSRANSYPWSPFPPRPLQARWPPGSPPRARTEREFFIDNLLVRIHFIIVMITWTDLAPWEFEFPFPGCPPLSRTHQCATHKTVKPRFSPWLSGKSPWNALNCPLFARKRTAERREQPGLMPPGVAGS